MKKIILFAASIIIFSCNDNVDIDKFSKVYTQILVVRELNSDSLTANQHVQKIIADNGYTMASFQKEFESLSNHPENLKKLYAKIKSDAKLKADSIRATQKPDTTRSEQE